jgi:hypothetical protein
MYTYTDVFNGAYILLFWSERVHNMLPPPTLLPPCKISLGSVKLTDHHLIQDEGRTTVKRKVTVRDLVVMTIFLTAPNLHTRGDIPGKNYNWGGISERSHK